MKLTERVKIITGAACNVKCRFCYYYYFYISKEEPTTEYIKNELLYAKRHGIKDVDFSGGEPTVRKDLPELLAFAKALGFRYRCIVTNGVLLSDEKYVKKLVDAGLNEVLFSIHGHNAETHDYLTQVPGSFKRLIKGMKIIKDYGLRLRTNTTVTKINVKHLSELSELLLKFEPRAVNFIKFNPWSSAYRLMLEMAARYPVVAFHVKKAIDILNPTIKKITVRYVPFCFMDGYEKYVCDCPQLRYDPDEWLPYIRNRLERGFIKHWAMMALGTLLYHPFKSLKGFNFSQYFNDIVMRFGQWHNVKIEACKRCKFFYICDGVEKLYLRIFGSKEIKPVKGEKIRDPMFFRRGYGDFSNYF